MENPLSANAILYRLDGSKRLADNALVALTLLIVENLEAALEQVRKIAEDSGGENIVPE